MKVFYAAVATIAVTTASLADTTLVFTEDNSSKPRNIFIKDGRVLMESGDGEVMLYERDRRMVTMIDHNRRAYFEMDPQKMAAQSQTMGAQMQQQAQQMAPMMKQMQAQFEKILNDPNIPESQKQMMRQQMQAMGGAGGGASQAPASPAAAPPPMTVKKTGENRRVAGIKCTMHIVSRGNQPQQEVCVATRKDAGVPRADYETMRGMFALMRETAEKSMASMGMQGGTAPFADYQGVPLQTVDLMDGGVSTLQQISTKKIDSARFTRPSGYRQYNPFGQ